MIRLRVSRVSRTANGVGISTLQMTKNAAGERMILIYHGNTPAIIKAIPRATVGTEKVMIFTLGYECVSSFEQLRAQQGIGLRHTSLSGLRSLDPSALIPSLSTAAFQASMCRNSDAMSSAVRRSRFFAWMSVPASRSWVMHLLFPVNAAQCSGVRPS